MICPHATEKDGRFAANGLHGPCFATYLPWRKEITLTTSVAGSSVLDFAGEGRKEDAPGVFWFQFKMPVPSLASLWRSLKGRY
jgi:hypothetical protein